MHKTVFKFLLFFLSLSLNLSAQDFSTLWQAHFSYNDIVDVVSGTNKIYAAAQNAVFEYDTLTEEIKTITTVEGLSGEQITTILYSEEFQYLVVGYETGLIEVYSETDNSVLSVVDILEKENITPDNKSINHFYEYDGLVYISTDYGISVYDLARLEFGDTYYIGGGGSQIIVNQVTILNDEIFAACSSGNGLKKADLNNPNLIDFSQWQTVIGGNFLKINTVDNLAYAIRANRAFFEITNTSFTQLFVLPFTPLDTEVNDNNLIISSINTVQVYNEAAQLIETYSNNDDFDTRFTITEMPDSLVKFSLSNSSLTFDKIEIYDVKGRRIYSLNGTSNLEVHKLSNITNSIFIVKAHISNGKVITKKAIMK